MLVQTKIQIEKSDHDFIKQSHKDLDYRSVSEYVRLAIRTKVSEDRRKYRALKRISAMEKIGRATHENLFETIEGDDFERR